MLFWSFVIALVIGIVCKIVEEQLWKRKFFCAEWLEALGNGLIVVAIICIVVSVVFFAIMYIGIDANVESNKQIYESLTYQLENNLYDNDNDVGKKELYNQIQEWNKDLASYQTIQDDFWIGIYCPDVFNQFEFIVLPGGE